MARTELEPCARYLKGFFKLSKILVVEDDGLMQDAISSLLHSQNHVCDVAKDASEASAFLRLYDYDLIILDWNLPGITGVELLRNYRAGCGSAPVLMLTAHTAVSDKETGLDSGADDYLTKPFHPKELSARVRSLLRRPRTFSSAVLKVAGLELDPMASNASFDGKELKLLPKEFSLLEFLMRHPNQTFSSEALAARVWSAEQQITPDSVRTYIKRLRRKLEESSPHGESIIQNVYGVGYKLLEP